MKNLKKTFSLALAGLLCFSVSASRTDEYKIDYITSRNIMQGYEDGSFRAENPITRGEFCQVIMNAFSDIAIKDIEIKFTDINSHWAKEAIIEAAKRGFINGVSENIFAPDDNITYEQAIAIITRINGVNLNYPTEVLKYALENGISQNIPVITGKNITRGEVLNLLYNVIEKADYEEEAKELTKSAETDSYYNNSVNYSASSGGSGGGSTSGMFALPSATPAMEADGYYDYGYYTPVYPNYNTEEYSSVNENIFKTASDSPFSTFSLDVDTASYSNLRRFLLRGQKIDSVRIEELINYFEYDLPVPDEEQPFSVTTEVHTCPWNDENYLAMVALKGYEIEKEDLPPSNLVFLIDVSGSMYSAEKLPLLKRSMFLLTDNLGDNDKVSIAVYAGSSGVVLDPTSDKDKIKSAITNLRAGGSTNGAAGIKLAYELAGENFIQDGNNCVILCTDGDFNVGQTSEAQLEELIEEKRESGVFLSVLGFGMGNYKDNKMELLADKGNGNYAYIDNIKEAKKVLVDDMTSTIFTIAKDVKLQIEFNPETVEKYRLIGYENRLLNKEDFDNDQKDAGEMGAGHEMIAFYEIVPNESGKIIFDSKYQMSETTGSDELMNITLRYKKPDENSSELLNEIPVTGLSENASDTFNFASAVAEFGLLLNDSEFKGNSDIDSLINRAYNNKDSDFFGYRAEFIQLVNLARELSIIK